MINLHNAEGLYSKQNNNCYSTLPYHNILLKDGVIMAFLITQQNLCKTATLKKTKIGLQDQLSLNAGQKYCRMLQWEHSAIL